jgi:integrase
MSRPSKGARLYLRPERRTRKGKLRERSTWIIRDNGRDISTGCAADEVAAAEQKLRDHITSKYTPKRKAQDIELIPISDVLSIYLDAALASLRDRFKVSEEDDDTIPGIRMLKKRIERLNDWWGAKMLDDVNGELCRKFVKDRGNKGGARRDLEDLRAAINHHAKEGLHRGVVRVSMPAKGRPRERWLTRSEAARLIWTCWRTREVQTVHRGPRKGERIVTDKRPLRHIARFVLIGVYSGTRAGAIATASPIPAIGRSYVDLDRGIFYRRARGKAETNKRQPPVPLPPRLVAHMRRWKERGLIASHFVEFNGEGVASVKTGFKHAVELAKLSTDAGNITPHTLRHTAATWLMQAGTDKWQAAGWLGMSMKMLEDTYGHHHPDHLAEAVEGITQKPKREQNKIVSGGISVGKKKSDEADNVEVPDFIGGPGRTRTSNQTVMSGRL